jgi:transposase InsO family protein
MQLPKMSTIKPKFKHKSDDSECPNLLKKQFNPAAPNQVWVSDITYVRVGGRFAYVCVIIDLRKLLILSVSRNLELVSKAFRAAYENRGKPSGVMFHSDRGTQYTSAAFRKMRDNADFVQSFSAKGHPYDNAVAESFFKFLKLEEIGRKTFAALEDLELSLHSYATFYNSQRPHGANDGQAPDDRERAFRSDH